MQGAADLNEAPDGTNPIKRLYFIQTSESKLFSQNIFRKK
jgi:hypothetical protein